MMGGQKQGADRKQEMQETQVQNRQTNKEWGENTGND